MSFFPHTFVFVVVVVMAQSGCPLPPRRKGALSETTEPESGRERVCVCACGYGEWLRKFSAVHLLSSNLVLVELPSPPLSLVVV